MTDRPVSAVVMIDVEPPARAASAGNQDLAVKEGRVILWVIGSALLTLIGLGYGIWKVMS